MDLAPTEEQRMLRQAARLALERRCAPEQLARTREAGGFDETLWRQAVGMGWPAALAPEPIGEGMNLEDAVVLLEECGRVLAPIPLASAMLAGWLAGRAGDAGQRDELLAAIASGEVVAVVAGPGRADKLAELPLRAEQDGQEWHLHGHAALVRDAAVCRRLLCLVTLDGATRVAVVPVGAAGVRVRPETTVGALREASVLLVGVRLAEATVLAAPLERADLDALQVVRAILEAAEVVGACDAVLGLTVSHATARVQFGRPIGSFQAVQHRMADMVADLDGCRWLLYRTASEAAAGRDAVVLAAQLSLVAGQASRRLLASAHQVHGGVGFIREHPLPMFFGRQKAAELSFGRPDEHRERIAAALLDGEEAQAP
jgi:alkylation response protein AidB-like acyl-CoA dehydrogenase